MQTTLKLNLTSLSRSIIPALSFLLSFIASAEGPVISGASSAPAQVAASPGLGGASGSPLGALPMMLLMFAALYFLMIRPQQKRVKEQQKMIAALSHGDEIVTASGFLGKITGIAEKVVTLEIADNVRVKVLKSQIAQVVKGQIKDLA